VSLRSAFLLAAAGFAALSPPLAAQELPYLVKDLNTVPLVESSEPREFTAFAGDVYFIADGDSATTALWRVDAQGRVEMVRDFGTRVSAAIPFFPTPLGDTLFLVGIDDEHGRELWRSDGTTDGTVLVRDINPGTGSSRWSVTLSSFAPATGSTAKSCG
jgi:ELWxxDGT repeat protein